ncbi:MAG TPA: multicopper oxidase domain-containing protein [Steroidobacteraceae bacterium]
MQCNSSSLLGRRAFLQLSGLAAAGTCLGPFANAVDSKVHVLRIRESEIELRPGYRFITTTYNGQFPGPVLRAAVGVPVCVDVINETDTTEQIHWQGQDVARGVVAAHSRQRMEFTPSRAGVYLYHSEVVAGSDLGAGLYSGQSGALLVEPVRESLVVLKGFGPFMRRTVRGCEVGYSGVTLNGRLPGPVRASPGERVLLQVLNAGATETYHLELPGHVFEVTALDGNPLAAPVRLGALQLSPGERVSARVVVNQPTRWVVRETDRPPTFLRGTNMGKPDETLPVVLTRLPAARSGFNRWSINGPELRVTAGARYRLQVHNTSDELIPLHLQRHRLQVHGVLKDVAVVGPHQRVEVDFEADGRGPALLHCTRQLHSDFGLRARVDYT